MAEYSATGDSRIIEALSRHYKNAERSKLLIKTDGYDFDFNERTMLHIEMLCWLYQKTGDAFFLDKAEHTYKTFCELGGPFTMQAFASEEVPIVHSVSSSETLKIPVILYINTGKKEYLNAALHGLKKVYAYHGLADGVPSGNEAHDWNRPNEVHETCDISDAQWMLGYFLQATGDVHWADLMEQICFNAAMGVVTKDFKACSITEAPIRSSPGRIRAHALISEDGSHGLPCRTRPCLLQWQYDAHDSPVLFSSVDEEGGGRHCRCTVCALGF